MRGVQSINSASKAKLTNRRDYEIQKVSANKLVLNRIQIATCNWTFKNNQTGGSQSFIEHCIMYKISVLRTF